MADPKLFFKLENGCVNKCGQVVNEVPGSLCEVFVSDVIGSNDEPGVVQLTCEDVLKGFHCKTINFLGKLNAWINGFLCWLANHEDRITDLENQNPVVDWNTHDNNNDGIYEVTVTFRDGSTKDLLIEDTDNRLTNPRGQDTNNNGIIDRIVWDVIDDEGNVVGSEIQLVQEYVDTNTQSTVTGISFNNSNRVFTLTQQSGGTKTTTIPGGGIELVSSPRLIEYYTTSSQIDVTRNVNLNTIAGVSVPTGAKGVIVRAKVSVSGPPIDRNCFATLYVNGIEVSYADMNVNDGDNDNTNDAFVRDTSLPTISYRFRQTLAGGGTNQQITQYWLYIVGFIL